MRAWRLSVVALGLLLVPTALADESGDFPTDEAQFLPTTPQSLRPRAAPGRDAALSFWRALLAEIDAEQVDAARLSAFVRPANLPQSPSLAWYQRLAHALGPDGALGEALRASSGPVGVQDGPDYTRIVLGGDVLLTVTVVAMDDGLWIDAIDRTTCALCSEPARFVRDLLADVAWRGDARRRLLPGVEVDVRDHLRGRPALLEARWPALFQARNQAGSELDALLLGAQVTGATGDVVHLTYGTGARDDWPLIYRESRWQLAYDALPAESPLRLDGDEVSRWKERSTLIRAAIDRWKPSFATTSGGAGVRVGHRAIGAHLDPRDGSVLVVVADLDRLLCGVFRVDPVARVVTERIAVPPPDPRTGVPLGSWFDRWPSALAPTGDQLAFALPSRLIRVDLAQRKVISQLPPHPVAGLSWSAAAPHALEVHRHATAPTRADVGHALPAGDAWSVNDALTAAASPAPTGGFVLWSARDGLVGRFGHGDVHQLVWSATGDALLSVHRDGTVWWWDVARLRVQSADAAPAWRPQ